MDLVDRVYRLHRILSQSRYPVSRARLLERLECSRATFTRLVRDMKDGLGAPIEYDRTANGYRYGANGDRSFELPGLWFNASELHALLACQQLLADAQPGLLDEYIDPLRQRITAILASKRLVPGNVAERVRILRMNARRLVPEHFQVVAGALLQRRRLDFIYHGRGRDDISSRAVSPQRLVHYRDNWYLDAWDHGKRALRTFALDRIREPSPLDKRASDIPEQRLNRYFTGSYGIFSGSPKHRAVLRFTPERARWVAQEQWHPDQSGRLEPDGSYTLEIPYGDDRELVLDILKYGPDVEAVAPASLRREVAGRLRSAVQRYKDDGEHR